MTTLYSVLFLLGVGAAVILCVRRPFAGLMVLAAVSPFYTLLRESSVGSPIFFVWPYILTAVLVLVMIAREAAAVLTRRGSAHPWRTIAITTAAVLAVIVAVLEADTKLLSRFFTDTTLGSMGTVLSSTSFTIVAYAGLAAIAATAVLFVLIMRRREGRASLLDIAVAGFVLVGIVSVFVTYARNGILFTGLNGFRYYFAGTLVYLPARYFMRSAADERRFVRVLVVACIVGAGELLLESLLLNTLDVTPQRLPWVVGHLAAEFGYQPEGGRTFFEGRFVPMGFMYMTHMSGLFLLLGYALLVPRVLTAPSVGRAARGLAILALLVLGAHWTSRTVLLLLAVTYAAAALATEVSWRRRFAGAALLAGAVVISAQFLIPGARYDLAGEIGFLSGRAFPNLVQAIYVDIREVVGLPEGVGPVEAVIGRPAPGAIPDGWTLLQNGTAERRSAKTEGRYILDLKATNAIDLRTTLPVWIVKPGERLLLKASLLTRQPSTTWIQLYQDNRVESSIAHRGDGQWSELAVELMAGDSNGRIGADVDVAASGETSIREVTVTSPRGTLVLLGRDRPSWLPTGWQLGNDTAASEFVSPGQRGDGVAGVRLLAGVGDLDFRRVVPASDLPPGRMLRVAAKVKATSSVALQLVHQDRIIGTDMNDRTGEWETLTLVMPRPSEGLFGVDVDVISGGEALLSEVAIATEQTARSFLYAEGRVEGILAEMVDRQPPGEPADVQASDPSAAVRSSLHATRSLLSRSLRVLFGHGAEFGMWNQVFFASQPVEFAAATYSDTKYIEFAQQFGLIGLAVLLAMGALAFWQSGTLALRSRTRDMRAHLLGLALIVLITYASLLHLPSLFRVGFGTVFFIAIAIVSRRSVAAQVGDDHQA